MPGKGTTLDRRVVATERTLAGLADVVGRRPEYQVLGLVVLVVVGLLLWVIVLLGGLSVAVTLVVGLILIPTTVGLALVRPLLGLLLCVGLLPFLPDVSHTLGKMVYPWEIALLCTVVAVLARAPGARRDIGDRDMPLAGVASVAVVGVVLAGIISVVHGRASGVPVITGTHPGSILRYAECGLLFWVAGRVVRTPRDLAAVAATLACTGALQAVFGLAQHFGWMSYRAMANPEVVVVPRAYLHWLAGIGGSVAIAGSGTMIHFQAFSEVTLMATIFSAGLAWVTKGRLRAWWVAVAVVSFSGLLVSYSRGGLAELTLAAWLLLQFVPRGPSAVWWRCLGYFLVVAVALGGWALASTQYAQTLTMESRPIMWAEAMKGFPVDLVELLLGRGWPATGVAVHGVHVYLLVEQGLLGLSTYVVLLLALTLPLRGAWRSPDRGWPAVCQGCAVAYLLCFQGNAAVQNAWGPGNVQLMSLYMLVGALSLAADQIRRAGPAEAEDVATDTALRQRHPSRPLRLGRIGNAGAAAANSQRAIPRPWRRPRPGSTGPATGRTPLSP